MIIRKLFILMITFIFCSVHTGCVSLVATKAIKKETSRVKHSVMADSNVEKASIFNRAGDFLGQTPCLLNLPYNKITKRVYLENEAEGWVYDTAWLFCFGIGLFFYIIDADFVNKYPKISQEIQQLKYTLLFKKEGYKDRYVTVTIPRSSKVYAHLEPVNIPTPIAPYQDDTQVSQEFYECDVRLVELATGKTVIAWRERANGNADLSFAADRIAGKFASKDKGEKKRIAVLDLDEINMMAQNEGAGKIMGSLLHTSIAKTSKFIVFERGLLKKIFIEHNFQTNSNGFSEVEMKKLIKLLAVDYIVIGTVAKFSK